MPGTPSCRPEAEHHRHEVIEAQAPRAAVHLLQVIADDVSGH